MHIDSGHCPDFVPRWSMVTIPLMVFLWVIVSRAILRETRQSVSSINGLKNLFFCHPKGIISFFRRVTRLFFMIKILSSNGVIYGENPCSVECFSVLHSADV